MKCESCGAEYADNLSVCPYCSGENEAAAQREQQQTLKGYQKATENVISLPEKIAKKASKGVSWIILAIIVLFFVAVGVVWTVTKIQAKYGVGNQNEKILTQQTWGIERRERLGTSYEM